MKKGFTLIELLAVIVILAIIALIATPIILNIIDDSIEQAKKRSAENYLEAVELEIARKNFKSEFNPSYIYITEKGSYYNNQDVSPEIDGELPSGGMIRYDNGKIVAALNLQYGDEYMTLANGKIKVTKTPLGDIDGDGKLSTDDGGAIATSIANEVYDENGDVDLDGELTELDHQLVQKYVVDYATFITINSFS